MADIWKDLSAGASITVAQRITIRMAATHAIHKAREAVDFAYNAAGATAIFENHPLERRFRDIHTVTQQLQGQLRHFETVGAWMMGADADLTFVYLIYPASNLSRVQAILIPSYLDPRRRNHATWRTTALHDRTL